MKLLQWLNWIEKEQVLFIAQHVLFAFILLVIIVPAIAHIFSGHFDKVDGANIVASVWIFNAFTWWRKAWLQTATLFKVQRENIKLETELRHTENVNMYVLRILSQIDAATLKRFGITIDANKKT